MKKTILKNYLKLGILLFGISFLLINCERDEILQEIQENSSIVEDVLTEDGIQIRTITLNQLQGKQDLQKTIEKISKSFDINKLKGSTTSKVDAYDGSFTILTDEIMEVITDSTQAYTFKIETPTNSTSTFENFVIDKPNDSIVKFYIYRYVYDDTSEDDFKYDYSYTEVDENILDITSFDNFLSKAAVACTVTIGCQLCNYGNCHDDGSTCIGDGSTTVWYISCMGGNGNSNGNNGNDDWQAGGDNTSEGGGGSATATAGSTDPSATGVLNEPSPIMSPEEIQMCDSIKAQIEKPEFIIKREILKDSLGLQHEIGYSQTDDNFNALSANSSTELSIPITSTMKGYMHTHNNSYETGRYDSEGNPEIKKPIKIFSYGDVITFLDLLLNAQTNNIPIIDVYGMVVTSNGNYQLRYTGNIADVNSNYDMENLRVKYLYLFETKYKYNKERAFLHFMKDEIGIDGVSLYRVKDNGKVTQKSLKNNERVESTTCD